MKRSLLLLFMLLLATNGLAITISPAKNILVDGAQQFAVTVAGQGIATIRAEGDLAQHIRFNQISARLEQPATFGGTVDWPSDLAPGDHTQMIIATYASEDGSGAVVEVASLLIIRKRLDTPYLQLSAYAAPDEGADTTTLYVGLENIGGAPTTPVVAVQRQRGTESIPFPELSPGMASRQSLALNGHGAEELQLIVHGAQGIVYPLSVAVGTPRITSFSAQAVAEQGPIKPVRVNANVDWNRPVPASLQLGQKHVDINIDGKLDDTFYIETNDTVVPLTLTLGRETRTIEVDLAAPVAQPMQWRNVLFAGLIIILVVIAAIILVVLWRARKPPLPPAN